MFYQNDEIKRMRRVGHVASMGEKRNSYKLSIEKPQGLRSLGRPRCRWKDDIKLCFKEIGLGEGVDWINLTQNRDQWRALVSTAMNFRLP
jgi:hypothetical protein